MFTWNLASNKTGKLTIPVLNNSLPHNYVIMPALLSHIDSPLSSLFSSPSKPQCHSINTSDNAKSSKLKKKFTNNEKLSFKSSKEIIYTTKRMKSSHAKEKQISSLSSLMTSSNLINDTSFSTSDQYFDCSFSVDKESDNQMNIHQQSIDYNQYEINQNNLVNTFTESNEKSSDNSNSNLSMINILPDKENFINESILNNQQNDLSIQNTSDYSSLFSHSASQQDLSHSNDLTVNMNFAYETISLNEEANEQENLNDDDDQNKESFITYAISYPSDWQYNLDNMLNCYVAFKNIGYENESFTNRVKLKCCVCYKEFSTLNDLVLHKEENFSCKNDIEITDENSFRKYCNKKKNKPIAQLLDNINNYYENEDDEEDLSEKISISDEEFQLNEEEEEDDEDDFDHLQFEDDDEDNLVDEGYINDNDDSNSYLKQNGKYLRKNLQKTKLLNEIAFHDSKQKNFEETGRRKYTRNKNDPKNFSNLVCEKCQKICRTKAELLVHKHKHSGKDPECWQCGKKCASFSNLISHVQLHTGEKPYTCQFCGKQFTQDAHLTRHIRLHTGERPFVCNICGKNYKDYSYYKTHLRIHRGERLYKCGVCNKEYYDASYYKKHTRLHTGEKPYMCTVCGRQFHRSDYLKLHSFSHTDERPFNCHICGKGFKMNYNLKIHLKNHDHDQSSAMNLNEETFNFNESLMITNNSSNYINSTSCSLPITSSNNLMNASFLNEDRNSMINNN